MNQQLLVEKIVARKHAKAKRQIFPAGSIRLGAFKRDSDNDLHDAAKSATNFPADIGELKRSYI